MTGENSLRCANCGKEILLSLVMTEGEVTFYCPRCHYYHKISASTTQSGTQGLTTMTNYDSLTHKIP